MFCMAKFFDLHGIVIIMVVTSTERNLNLTLFCKICLQDNMSHTLLEIICFNDGVSVYKNYDNLFRIHNEEYLCITYDGNNLFGYRSENLKKENMIQMTLKSMQILPYQILFFTGFGKDAIPFRLFRVSNKFNDIYYAK